MSEPEYTFEQQSQRAARRVAFRGKRAAKLAARIRRRNARFARLTKAQQRVAVAREVLARLDAKRIVPASMYLLAPMLASDFRSLVQRGEAAGADASVLVEQLPGCRACGIGSMFLALVSLRDKLPLQVGFDTRDSMVDYIAGTGLFTKEDTAMVEFCFERGERGTTISNLGSMRHPEYLATLDSDVDLYDRLSYLDVSLTDEADGGRETRLRMIMENIIGNRGRFSILRGPHSLKTMVSK